MNNRITLAKERLGTVVTTELTLLGEGKSSVVFRDEQLVYKVFLLDEFEALKYKHHIADTILSSKWKYAESRFFFPILDVLKVDDHTFVLTYPFEKSLPCKEFKSEEILDFLSECWQKRLIFQDLKPENFVRVNKHLRWIDYEPDKYTDNLFLNMAVRAFIYCKYHDRDSSFIHKLCRSAINQFDLQELIGSQAFLNRLFAKIIFNESGQMASRKNDNGFIRIDRFEAINSAGSYSLDFNTCINPEKEFWKLLCRGYYLKSASFTKLNLNHSNLFEPELVLFQVSGIQKPSQPVSLIIKACVQDAEVIYQAVKHCVRQLSFPQLFDEIILALDTRESDFLREYNSKSSWFKLTTEAERLRDDLIITKVIYAKPEDILKTNERWFNTLSSCTHTKDKIPVTSQLFAFDQAKNDYVLQLDSDVIIGRLDKSHAFLEDMISAIEKDEKTVSVGFNIYHGNIFEFKDYSGEKRGGFIPEVRFCLLKKSRIDKILPLRNEIITDNFELSWYRSLHKKQCDTGTTSVRGGDSRSFYIHPQNFKKSSPDRWFTMVDRVEQHQLPTAQIDEFDLAGSSYDWSKPIRNEDLVIVSCLRNLTLPKFLRYWESLVSQSYTGWGLILIDDASDNGLSHFIKHLIEPFKDKVTFIQNRFRIGIAANTQKAIHYFIV